MKNKINLLLVVMCLFTSSCVQKSYDQEVKLILDVSGIPNIKTVGVRGEGKPLSWDEDFEMKPIVKDSLYSTTISGKTGYLFTEIKFVINGKFEFENSPNRRIYFDKSQKTILKAKFNKVK